MSREYGRTRTTLIKPETVARPLHTVRRLALTGDLASPLLRERLQRSGIDYLRRTGQYRRLVLPLIRAGQDPSPADIAAALRETPPDPSSIAAVPWTDAERAAILRGVDYTTIRASVAPGRREAAREQAAAQIAADTATLHEYVIATYIERVHRRREGRKAGSRSLAEEFRIAAAYFAARRAQPDRGDLVKQDVARQNGLSVRALERLIRNITPHF